MKEFYLYSEKKINNTINEIFIDFKIHFTSLEKIKKNSFINQNIFLVLEKVVPKDLNKSFFSNNNVVIFYTPATSVEKKISLDAKIFNKHQNINKFTDEVTTYFVENQFNYHDISIAGERVINNISKKEIYLTTLEKDILILLIDQKQIEKNFLLEGVLKIKKDTETKTIESHLTRIRNKLSKINSKLKIISKENKVFLLVSLNRGQS